MANEIIKDIRIHHIALKVSDFEKSVRFYSEGLGFKVYRQWGNEVRTIALVDIGDDSYLELFSDGTPREGDREQAGDFIHLAFRVKDTRAAYEQALAAGATPHIAPKEAVLGNNPPLNVSLSFVKGPDGEQLEFFQPHED